MGVMERSKAEVEARLLPGNFVFVCWPYSARSTH